MKKLLKNTLLSTLAASMLLSAAGCGKTSDVNRGSIAVIAKSKGVEFWDDVKVGADDGGKEMNLNIAYSAPSSETQINEQIQMVNDAVKNKSKAIVIAPISADNQELVNALKAASDAGINVITIDSDLTDTNMRKSCISTNNDSAGAIAAREAAQLLGADGGQVAIIGHAKDSQTATERIDGFTQQLTGASENPDKTIATSKTNFNVVEVQYSDGDQAKAKQEATDLISKYPDLKLIYGTNEKTTIGICEAVKEQGKSGQIKVIGFNASKTEIDDIKNGTLNGTIVQNPYSMGYLGVRVASKLMNNKNVISSVDTGATYVSADNMDQEYVKLLLDPTNK